MRIRVLILALALSSPAAAQEPAGEAAPERAELGVRWWVSTGEHKVSHNAQIIDPTLGNPTSILIWDNLDANSVELFGRQVFARHWFLKGFIGLGRLNTGSLDDEDFNAAQVKFSDTTSSVTDGSVAYGAVDVGRQWAFGQGGYVGLFAGFSQWTDDIDVSGITATTGSSPALDDSVKVISYKVRWRALRVGVAGQAAVGRARLLLDLAFAPYAEFRNEDSHHLRGDLGPVPNIVDSGNGWGVQSDLELRYAISKQTQLGLGVRYWYFEARDGTTDFHNFTDGRTPIVDMESWRLGATLSLRRVW